MTLTQKNVVALLIVAACLLLLYGCTVTVRVEPVEPPAQGQAK